MPLRTTRGRGVAPVVRVVTASEEIQHALPHDARMREGGVGHEERRGQLPFDMRHVPRALDIPVRNMRAVPPLLGAEHRLRNFVPAPSGRISQGAAGACGRGSALEKGRARERAEYPSEYLAREHREAQGCGLREGGEIREISGDRGVQIEGRGGGAGRGGGGGRGQHGVALL
ncbi:MAG: hypothetical protein SGPRY_004172 [Prymnesium sp.]